jgi:hypothetical protein
MSDVETILYGLALAVYDVVGIIVIVWGIRVVLRACKGRH